MPDTFINDVFTDITWTAYPARIDSRTTIPNDVILKGTSTVMVPAILQSYNSDLDLNEDYMHYVMADDVNVLQDSIIAIQRIIGVMPHIGYDFLTDSDVTYTSINARLYAIERRNYDKRYVNPFIPAGWTYDSTKDTIYTHKHNSNGINGPSKIDLVNEVQNKLRDVNLQLDPNQPGAVTAGDIIMATDDPRTVQYAINIMLPRTAGPDFPVTGDLYLYEKLFGGLYGEWDANNHTAPGNRLTDANAYKGFAAVSPSTAGWFVLGPDIVNGWQHLRYTKFCLSVRLRLSEAPSVEPPGRILRLAAGPVVPSDAEIITTRKDIYTSDFDEPVTEYQNIYLTFDHKPYNGSNKFFFGLWWYGGISGQPGFKVYVDSIIITPAHTSVYDD